MSDDLTTASGGQAHRLPAWIALGPSVRADPGSSVSHWAACVTLLLVLYQVTPIMIMPVDT